MVIRTAPRIRTKITTITLRKPLSKRVPIEKLCSIFHIVSNKVLKNSTLKGSAPLKSTKGGFPPIIRVSRSHVVRFQEVRTGKNPLRQRMLFFCAAEFFTQCFEGNTLGFRHHKMDEKQLEDHHKGKESKNRPGANPTEEHRDGGGDKPGEDPVD